jgi:hypothetical protein
MSLHFEVRMVLRYEPTFSHFKNFCELKFVASLRTEVLKSLANLAMTNKKTRKYFAPDGHCIVGSVAT